jgi:hypothetical protein
MSESEKDPDAPPDKSGDDRPGAEGGRSESANRPPGAPADDAAPVGDTDQHSDADA